jgi:hypothetical protein
VNWKERGRRKGPESEMVRGMAMPRKRQKGRVKKKGKEKELVKATPPPQERIQKTHCTRQALYTKCNSAHRKPDFGR